MSRRLLAVLFLLLAVTPVSAAAPNDAFQAANHLYDAGQFAAAADAYQAIEPKTAHVWFNLGNAWFRQDHLGRAILAYERARRLAPRDPDILANLRFAERRLGIEDLNTDPRPVRRFLHRVIWSRTPNEWAVAELIGIWLAVLASAGCVWLPRLRLGLTIVAVLATIWLAGAALALAGRAHVGRAAPTAIVLTAKTPARFAPLADATTHFEVVEGQRVSIREDRGPWVLIERADGQQGWVPKATVERVQSV